MQFLIVIILLVIGGIGGGVIINVFDVSGYAIMLGMIIALLCGILLQLTLMHQDRE